MREHDVANNHLKKLPYKLNAPLPTSRSLPTRSKNWLFFFITIMNFEFKLLGKVYSFLPKNAGQEHYDHIQWMKKKKKNSRRWRCHDVIQKFFFVAQQRTRRKKKEQWTKRKNNKVNMKRIQQPFLSFMEDLSSFSFFFKDQAS